MCVHGAHTFKPMLELVTQDEFETWMLLEFCDRGSLHRAVERGRISSRNAQGQPDMVRVAWLLAYCQLWASARCSVLPTGVSGSIPSMLVIPQTHLALTISFSFVRSRVLRAPLDGVLLLRVGTTLALPRELLLGQW